MDIIAITRELGKQLQQEESYIKMRAAQQACDEDEGLQKAIGEFNLKRMAINNEAQKDDRNEETLQRLNGEFRAAYALIMETATCRRITTPRWNLTPSCSGLPASSACALTGKTRKPATMTQPVAAGTAPPAGEAATKRSVSGRTGKG